MRKQLSLLLAGAMLCALVSCAETPEDTIVAKKNTERLVEAAADTADENRQPLEAVQQTAPERYTFDYTSENGKVHIAADAEVLLPETDTIPMYQLSACAFTQEQATAIFNYLFAGRKAWYLPEGTGISKEQADERLIQLRQHLAQAQQPVEGESEDERERREAYAKSNQEDISNLEEAYSSLPDSLEPLKIYTDGTFATASTYYGASDEPVTYECLDAKTDEGDRLYIKNPIDSTDTAHAEYYSGPNAEGMEYDENQCGGTPLTPEEAERQINCKYSYEQAKAIADGLLEAAGVEAELVQVTGSKRFRREELPQAGGERFEYEEQPSAYAFYYAREVDATPVAVTTSQYIYHEDTAPVWLYESIQIAVNDDGIAWMNWSNPVQVDESISNNVNILPFETAAETFQQMTPLVYQGNIDAHEANSTLDAAFDVKVDRVELNLMRVRSSGEALTGLYVPAWVFYGTENLLSHNNDMDSDYEDAEPSPWIILAVNAVDATVIDVVAGY